MAEREGEKPIYLQGIKTASKTLRESRLSIGSVPGYRTAYIIWKMDVGIRCGIERLLRWETPPPEGRSVFDEGEIDLIIISIGSRGKNERQEWSKAEQSSANCSMGEPILRISKTSSLSR